MKVILAPSMRECELEAYERKIPPRGRDVLLLPTNSGSTLKKARGHVIHPENIIEVGHGRYHDEIMRTLEPGIIR